MRPAWLSTSAATRNTPSRAEVEAGATSLRAVEDKFYGDRGGDFEDRWGHRWSVATHIEDVAPDEMARRVAALEG